MPTVTLILIILFSLFAVFILVGVFIPKVNFSSSIEVNKPIGECWNVFMDDSKLSEWLPGFKSTEHLSGENNAVGSTYNMIFEEKGKTFEMMETLTTVETNKQFSFNLDHKVMSSSNDVFFESNGNNTIIKGATSTKGKGLIMRAMFPFLKKSMQKNNQLAYANLKKLIEAS